MATIKFDSAASEVPPGIRFSWTFCHAFLFETHMYDAFRDSHLPPMQVPKELYFMYKPIDGLTDSFFGI